VDGTPRYDSLSNVWTGLGREGLDIRKATEPNWVCQRTVWELEQEAMRSWMAYREVTTMAAALFREGFDLLGLPDGYDTSSIKSWLEGDLKIRPDGTIDRGKGIAYYAWRLREVGDWLGGAVLFAIVDDGLDPVEPLDVRRIRRVLGWEVLARDEITPWMADGWSGGEVKAEYYVLSSVLRRPIGRRNLQPGEVIHESRLWVHPGRRLPPREERMRQGWGASVLELNWDQRRGVEESTEYARSYVHRASWLHWSCAMLNEVQQTKDPQGNDIGETVVANKLRAMRQGAHTFGIVATDGGRGAYTDAEGNEFGDRPADRLESIGETIGDLDKLWQMDLDQWGYGSEWPRSFMFGEGANGLRGGDNKSDWQIVEGKRNAEWRNWAQPGLNWMMVVSFAAKDGPTGGRIPSKWTAEPRPLIVPTPMEKALLSKAQAEADNARIQPGCATPEEVRNQRLVRGEVDTPLRVEEERHASDVVSPVLVGVATGVLEGLRLVAEGTLSAEAFALWADATDASHYPYARALAMGRDAEAGRSKPAGTEFPAAPAGIPPQVLLNAGIAVAKGELQPEYIEASLPVMDPSMSPERAAELAEAAQGGPQPEAAPVGAPPVAGPISTTGPALATADAVAGAQVPAAPNPAAPSPAPDPFAILADIPDDLMTPADIVALIQQRTRLAITTRQVHALAKKHRARSGRVGGAMGYSAGDIADAIARDNGALPPAEELPEPDGEE
jgi:hypothetical protein